MHMCSHDLPDMYALSPRVCGPRALGMHIRQIPRAHVTTITCIMIATPKRDIIISRVVYIDQLKTIIMKNQYLSCIQYIQSYFKELVSLSFNTTTNLMTPCIAGVTSNL